LAQRGSNVGRYDITASGQLADLNRNYNVTFDKGTAEITRRNVSVKASDTSSVYGDDITLQSYEFVNGTRTFDNQSLDLTVKTTATKGSDVGRYDILADNDFANSNKNSNYNITFIKGQAEITPRAITVKFDNKVKQIEYGDAIDLRDYVVVGADSNFNRSNLSGSLQTKTKRGDNVGTTNEVTIGTLGADQTQAKNKNYIVSVEAGNMVEITPRNVTVVADLVQRAKGAENPELTYTFQNGRGMYNGEKLSGSMLTTADKDSFVGDYIITRGDLGMKNTNYQITFRDGVLRVVDSTATATNMNTTYVPPESGIGWLKVGYRIGGSNFYTRAVGQWDGTIEDGEKPVQRMQPRFSDIMVCTNPESDCSISIAGKDRQTVIFAR